MDYDGFSEFLKAAPKRLNDAWELLEAPSRNRDASDAAYRHVCAAYYLAGYAVECILKVYIMRLVEARSQRTRISRWPQAVQHLARGGNPIRLSGAHSHDLAKLYQAAELAAQVETDRKIADVWTQCAKWDYAARYCPQFLPEAMRDRTAVAEFVSACDTMYHWIAQRVP